MKPTWLGPAPDLDGDGTGDLVWSVKGAASFLALSGEDGSMLWNYGAELDGLGGPRPDGPVVYTPNQLAVRNTAVLESVFGDLDRDGAPDLISTIQFYETAEEVKRRSAGEGLTADGRNAPLFRRIVVAASGRSGRWLWSYPLDKTFRGNSADPGGRKPRRSSPGDRRGSQSRTALDGLRSSQQPGARNSVRST